MSQWHSPNRCKSKKIHKWPMKKKELKVRVQLVKVPKDKMPNNQRMRVTLTLKYLRENLLVHM